MFHDGIILTTHSGVDINKIQADTPMGGEEIIYRNKRLEKIFDV